MENINDLYRVLFQQSRDGVFIIDFATGQVVDANQAFLDIFGYKRKEIKKLTVADLLADAAAQQQLSTKLIQEGELKDYLLPIRRKDGTVRETVHTVTAQRDDDGRVQNVLGMLRDVTEQKQNEALSRQRQKFLEALNGLTQDITAQRDPMLILETAAKRVVELFDATSAYISNFDEQQGVDRIIVDYYAPTASKKERQSDLGATYTLDDLEQTLEELKEDNFYLYHVGDPATPNFEAEQLKKYGGQTILGVPLLFQGELIGILEVWDSQQKREYSDTEIEMIQAIGQQVALAVSNARYTKELEKQVQERKRAEAALRAREETVILNQEKLKALQEVTTALDRTDTLERLYHQAIELGRHKLGFERLGLLLFDQESKQMRGTFGINEEGVIVDEREMVIPPGEQFLQLIESNERAVLWEDVPLFTSGEETGHGWNAIAVLWDGAKGIGWLATDNFISHSPPPPYLLDILTLYGDTIGHLISRKRSEENMRESEQRLTHLIQQSPLAVIEWNLDFEVREWNLAAENILKYSRANSLGQHARFIIPEAYHEHVDAVWEDLVTNTGGSRSTNDNVTAEGQIITCEWYNTPITNDEGKVIGVVSLVQDISEQQKLEQQVQESLTMRDRQLEIGRALTTAQTEEEILQTIVDQVDQYPHVACSVTLIEMESDSLVDVVQAQNAHESGLKLVPLNTRRLHEENPLADLYGADDIFVSQNMGQDKRLPATVRKEFKKAKVKSLATLPLTAGGEWLGNLTLITQQEEFFNEQTLLLYQSVAEQGAISLRAARLFQEVQSSLARREREVAVTTQIAQEIANATDLSDLYRRVVNQIHEQFGYYHTQLLRYDPGMETLALTVGYGEVGEKMLALHYSIPVGVGLIGLAAGTGRSILRPYLTNDADWQPNPLLADARGELAVPIKLGNEVLGVLDVQSNTAGALNENDQLILEGLCGQIAVAIESTTLRQDMEARLRELNILQRQMSREGWQEYRTTRQLTTGYQYDHAGIHALTAKTETPTNGQGKNGKQSADTAVASPVKPVDAPLQIRGETIGLLGIQATPDQPLTGDEEEFLTAVSQEIAEALEAARLFEQTQDALAEQERLTSELETVAQVSTAASTILEVDALLQAVVDLSKSSFNLYHVHIYLINETGRKLILKAGAGNVGRLMALEGREISIEAESLIARAARTRQGVLENNVRKTVDFMPHPLLPNTQSEMAIPLIVGDKLIGVLDLQSDQPESFTPEDLKIQRTLASQVAIAVENARQYVEQVETSVKLREVDQLKSEFLASMSHELRTPLNSIIGFADVLLEGLDGELNERMEEDVRLIRESGRHLRELIGDILDMSKIEAGRMELRYEEVDLRQMASDIMATAASLASEKDLDMYLDLGDKVNSIQADRTRLRQVLWNIMGNAIKFTEKGSVSLSIHDQGGHVLFAIRDTGIGIKEENVAVVFEQFRQIDGGLNRAAGGTGLGMPITKKLVEIHGGDIWIESVYGQGTTFFFTLPYIPPEW